MRCAKCTNTVHLVNFSQAVYEIAYCVHNGKHGRINGQPENNASSIVLISERKVLAVSISYYDHISLYYKSAAYGHGMADIDVYNCGDNYPNE